MEGIDVGNTSDQSTSEIKHEANRSEKHEASQHARISAGPSRLLSNNSDIDNQIEGK